MTNTEKIMRDLSQIARLNKDGGRTQTSEICYAALTLIKKLDKQNSQADEVIKTQNELIEKLEAENEILVKNADSAFQDGLNENKALFVKEIRSEIEEVICQNTYPGFSQDGKPVNIWNAKNGYKAVEEVIERMAELKYIRWPFFCADVSKEDFEELKASLKTQKVISSVKTDIDDKGECSFIMLPFKVGEKVFVVIEDEEYDEKIFISTETVTDISRKGVWISEYEPPEDDCSSLITWDEFGKDAFVDYDAASVEVRRRLDNAE